MDRRTEIERADTALTLLSALCDVALREQFPERKDIDDSLERAKFHRDGTLERAKAALEAVPEEDYDRCLEQMAAHSELEGNPEALEEMTVQLATYAVQVLDERGEQPTDSSVTTAGTEMAIRIARRALQDPLGPTGQDTSLREFLKRRVREEVARAFGTASEEDVLTLQARNSLTFHLQRDKDLLKFVEWFLDNPLPSISEVASARNMSAEDVRTFLCQICDHQPGLYDRLKARCSN